MLSSPLVVLRSGVVTRTRKAQSGPHSSLEISKLLPSVFLRARPLLCHGRSPAHPFAFCSGFPQLQLADSSIRRLAAVLETSTPCTRPPYPLYRIVLYFDFSGRFESKEYQCVYSSIARQSRLAWKDCLPVCHILKLLLPLRFPFHALKKRGRTFFSIPDELAVRGIRGSSCDAHDLGALSLSSGAAIVSAFMRS